VFQEVAEVRPIRIDAKTFQEPLGLIASTMVEKVYREGDQHISGAWYVSGDLATLLRYAASVYNLLNYLNADQRRKEDCDWFVRYGVTAMSLVRSLIDCLYNVVAILEDPAARAVQYRKSGFKKALGDLAEDERRYCGQDGVEEYVRQRHESLDTFIRASGFTRDEIMAMPKSDGWPTFGQYVNAQRAGGSQTDIQKFLKTFTHLHWRQYSALSHGAYEAFIGTLGHIPVGSYYLNDFMPHETRDKVEESYNLFVSTHLVRSATVLLCIVTELQAYCRFDGANINRRICDVWAALLPSVPVLELFDARYAQLMRGRGMIDDDEEAFGRSYRDVGLIDFP
jgi:hypothetical protein